MIDEFEWRRIANFVRGGVTLQITLLLQKEYKYWNWIFVYRSASRPVLYIYKYKILLCCWKCIIVIINFINNNMILIQAEPSRASKQILFSHFLYIFGYYLLFLLVGSSVNNISSLSFKKYCKNKRDRYIFLL